MGGRQAIRSLTAIAVGLVLAVTMAGCGSSGGNDEAPSEAQFTGPALDVEPQGRVETLPAVYPESWFFAHDLNFFNAVDGKLVLLDAAATTRNYKGQLPAGFASSIALSSKRNEIYIAETLHERRVTGPRHDLLTIYDTATFTAKAHIELPAKKLQSTPFKASAQIIGDRYLLIYNFNPASSATVVDLDSRSLVGEIDLSGCALIYPTGDRAFSSICGDGTLLTTKLDEGGKAADTTRSSPFIDIDNNAMFVHYAQIGTIKYFPTYLGDVQPIDFGGDEPKILPPWSLTTDSEREAGWRPGGWQFVAAAPRGKEFFVIMHEEGAEGSHKNPGAEIWVFDPQSKRRLRKLQLKTPAISIHLTGGADPALVAFNVDMELDIYSAESGEWIRKIGNLATETAFGFHGVR